MLSDKGYFSGANVKACIAAGVEPLIALGRETHHQSLAERFADAPPAPQNPTPVEAMATACRQSEGKKLYAKANTSLNRCSASSSPTLAWNLKRMFALKAA